MSKSSTLMLQSLLSKAVGDKALIESSGIRLKNKIGQGRWQFQDREGRDIHWSFFAHNRIGQYRYNQFHSSIRPNII